MSKFFVMFTQIAKVKNVTPITPVIYKTKATVNKHLKKNSDLDYRQFLSLDDAQQFVQRLQKAKDSNFSAQQLQNLRQQITFIDKNTKVHKRSYKKSESRQKASPLRKVKPAEIELAKQAFQSSGRNLTQMMSKLKKSAEQYTVKRSNKQVEDIGTVSEQPKQNPQVHGEKQVPAKVQNSQGLKSAGLGEVSEEKPESILSKQLNKAEELDIRSSVVDQITTSKTNIKTGQSSSDSNVDLEQEEPQGQNSKRSIPFDQSQRSNRLSELDCLTVKHEQKKERGSEMKQKIQTELQSELPHEEALEDSESLFASENSTSEEAKITKKKELVKSELQNTQNKLRQKMDEKDHEFDPKFHQLKTYVDQELQDKQFKEEKLKIKDEIKERKLLNSLSKQLGVDQELTHADVNQSKPPKYEEKHAFGQITHGEDEAEVEDVWAHGFSETQIGTSEGRTSEDYQTKMFQEFSKPDSVSAMGNIKSARSTGFNSLSKYNVIKNIEESLAYYQAQLNQSENSTEFKSEKSHYSIFAEVKQSQSPGQATAVCVLKNSQDQVVSQSIMPLGQRKKDEANHLALAYALSNFCKEVSSSKGQNSLKVLLPSECKKSIDRKYYIDKRGLESMSLLGKILDQYTVSNMSQHPQTSSESRRRKIFLQIV